MAKRLRCRQEARTALSVASIPMNVFKWAALIQVAEPPDAPAFCVVLRPHCMRSGFERTGKRRGHVVKAGQSAMFDCPCDWGVSVDHIIVRNYADRPKYSPLPASCSPICQSLTSKQKANIPLIEGGPFTIRNPQALHWALQLCCRLIRSFDP